ncbi:hypothetical protein CPB83DRAFT_841559 [Crepidotus variabilis]|uniref:Pkinase-domain-containing protein n=1 Tax=Crepidotus variabilis TaxID=179855 RepID=A0A9P6EU20_9AGAR|nr:hypothetical protein CPB83DRAFT_841559 [Crepidotus variabilis]
MSAIMANNPIFASDNSPTKTPSPSSPTTSLMPTRPYGRAPLQPLKYQQYTPIEAPVGMSYTTFLRTWTDDHVARWLNEIKCGCHQDTFQANDIRGDVILELDQITLQEMGIASIGDRLRILNAVKILRQKVSGKSTSTISPSHHRTNSSLELKDGHVNGKSHNRRLDNGRPAPLQLNGSAARGDLPSIARDPDSARIPPPSQPQPIRPLPMPQQSTPPSSNTPSSAQLSTPNIRANLPPLPPPPRGQPPLPPSGRPNRAYSNSPVPDAPAYTTQPPPPPPNQGHLTPSGAWHNQHLPSDPRPGNPGGKAINRSISPVPPARLRPSGVQGLHARSGSYGTTTTTSSPNKRTVANNNNHPYASAQPAIHHPTSNLATNLSPIDESFAALNGGTSVPTYTVGRGPFVGGSSSNSPQTSWDDLRKRIIKFVIPDEGLSFTIDVTSCSGGVEVVEKVLRKFSKSGPTDVGQTDDGGLLVDSWAVFMDMGSEDGLGMPLSEAQLLSICHAPNHPTREHGLVLRRLPRTSSPLSNITNRNTKRASSISILSGLGVHDPERALDTASVSSGRSSPAALTPAAAGKKPSKLRNFFGQRPPSELITNHLTEFFPNTEKKVLQRTARHSMMRRRDSVASYNSGGHLSSRFSISTQGSGSRSSNHLQPPPVPDKGDSENLPRVSLSTDDGRSVDLHLDDHARSTPQHLPPIPFPTESLSESMEDLTHDQGRKRASRALSIASKRMSYMTELRSKRDRSDTASLMTVDEITAEVESRRASGTYEREDELDGWTKVDTEIESMVPKAVADDDTEEGEETAAESDESSISSDEEDETLHDEEEELSLDVDDDGVIRNIVSAKRANKWIKGALIGAGSFGKVYLGMDASSGLLMAVKQVELPTGSGPNQERKKSMLTALEREIELLKNLEHENIVQYLYSSIDDEFLNIFLEYVPGGSVTALLRNYGAFEETLVKNFVRQILQGLDYLHGRDIIHRDIKGANILVDNKGGVKISDFGISKKVDDNLLTGNRMNRPSLQGSVFWMAPEVVKQSSHTRKADIWSVGCLVVEMLTGEHPWAQLTQMQAIFKIGSSAAPAIPSDISADAQDFLKQTFKIDHEARPGAVELLSHAWIAVKPTK